MSELTRSLLARYSVGPRKNFPGIPEPVSELNSLLHTVQALKIAVETLIRQRGTKPDDSAVLIADLDELVDYLDRRYDKRYGGV